jgi:hypothetical protein
MLVRMLATCVALSWLGLKVRQAGEQRKAVEAILRLGGTVSYDYLHDWIAPAPPPIFTPTDQPTRPRFVWLREQLRDDLFANVKEVHLRGPEVTRTAGA